jgi:hypothetical protein
MKKTSELIAELEQATKGLLVQSESDYPVAPFSMEAKGARQISAPFLMESMGLASDLPVEEVTMDEFFHLAVTDEDWHGPKQREKVQRFRRLVQTLKENLSDIIVYRIGEVEIDVFVVGKTEQGDFAGVSTRVVET